MTGEHVENNRCPLCGGHLRTGKATIPFIFSDAVIVVKNVPAEICSSCHEAYMTGRVTDRLTSLLNSSRNLSAEVLIISYPESQPASVLMPPIPAHVGEKSVLR